MRRVTVWVMLRVRRRMMPRVTLWIMTRVTGWVIVRTRVRIQVIVGVAIVLLGFRLGLG